MNFFDISFTPISEHENIGSLCFCISKKKIPLSVHRHQLKRYLFEYFRLNRFWIDKYHVWIRYNSKKKFNKLDFNYNKIYEQISNKISNKILN